jgi:hypothetical protein
MVKRIRSLSLISLRDLLVFVLIFQSLSWGIPPAAFAGDTEETHPTHAGDQTGPVSLRGDDSVPERIIAEATHAYTTLGPGARLPMSEAARNLWSLVDQRLVFEPDEAQIKKGYQRVEYQLGVGDRTVPKITVPAGSSERLLQVKVLPQGLQLSIEGFRWKHQIFFKDGRQVRDYALDNEKLVLLFDDGRLSTVPLNTLDKLIYNHGVQVFHHRKFAFPNGVPEGTRIRIIQRRFEDLDHSRAGREAHLDRLAKTRRRVLSISDTRLVSRLERSLERTRDIPLHPALASADGLLWARDVALVAGEPQTEAEQIVGVVPEDALMTDIENQLHVAQAVMSIVDGKAEMNAQRLMTDQAEVVKEIEDLLADPAFASELFQSDNAAVLSNFPRGTLKLVEKRVQALREGSGGRDYFTPEMWRSDQAYLERLVAAAKWKAARSHTPRSWRRLLFNAHEAWAHFDWGAGLDRLTKVIKVGGVIAGVGATGKLVDHAVLGDEGTGLAVDTFTKSWNWFLDRTPVLKDWDYTKLLLMYSMPCQAAIPGLVYGVGALASPFTQYKPSVLIATTGIRTFARVFQAPHQELLFKLSGQTPMLRAMQHGDWMEPIGGDPLVRELLARARSNEMQDDRRRQAIASLIACSVVSFEHQVDPGELYVLSHGGDPASQLGAAAALEVRELILEQLRSLAPDEWHAVVAAAPDQFLVSVRQLQNRAKVLAETGARRASWERMRHHATHIAKVRILQRLANMDVQTMENLGSATPDDVVSRLILQSLIIDYEVSLGTAAFWGDFANPAKPIDLHAKKDAFLYTNPMATSENGQQMAIGLGRGAAGTYMSMLRELLGINQAHMPAEFAEIADGEITNLQPLFRETGAFLRAFFDFRANQPGEYADRTVRNGRIKLFKSTLAIGLLPRLLLGGQTWNEALDGQGKFMACAMWAFGFPNFFAGPGIARHEDAVKEQYTAWKMCLVGLSKTSRMKLEAKAEDVINVTLQYARQGTVDLENPIPEREAGELASTYAGRLLDFFLKNPVYANRPRAIFAQAALFVTSVTTTIAATYMYTKTFHQKNINWFGFNWSDWNLFLNIPDGDGVPALALKSALTLMAWVGAWRIFDWTWDAISLKQHLAKLVELETGKQNEVDKAKIPELREKIRNLEERYHGRLWNWTPAGVMLKHAKKQLAILEARTPDAAQAKMKADLTAQIKKLEERKGDAAGALAKWTPNAVVVKARNMIAKSANWAISSMEMRQLWWRRTDLVNQLKPLEVNDQGMLILTGLPEGERERNLREVIVAEIEELDKKAIAVAKKYAANRKAIENFRLLGWIKSKCTNAVLVSSVDSTDP